LAAVRGAVATACHRPQKGVQSKPLQASSATARNLSPPTKPRKMFPTTAARLAAQLSS